jgi:hypothetical protein
MELAFLSAKDASLYWNNPDYGTLLDDGGRYQQMTPTRTEYAYLFRRQLLLENPHNVDASIQHLCQRVFVKTAGMCTGRMDVRLTHAESLCQGTRGANKHFSMQNAIIMAAWELGIPVSTSRDTGYEIER